MDTPNHIKQKFIVLNPDKKASIEAADAGLYQRLDEDYAGFKGHELISCHEFDAAWGSWEMHPKGDEIVMLMDGAVTMVLQHEKGDETVELTVQGQYVVVPQGIWHTAKTSVPSKLLFITPGQGTQHK